MSLDPKEFSIDIIGEKSGKQFSGKFKSKVLLSNREMLSVDNIRRSLLGSDPTNSGSTAGAMAGVLAELSVRLIEVPPFWKDSNGGLDLIDEDPVVAIFEKVKALETEHIASIKKQGEKAKEELKTLVSNSTPAVDLSKA